MHYQPNISVFNFYTICINSNKNNTCNVLLTRYLKGYCYKIFVKFWHGGIMKSHFRCKSSRIVQLLHLISNNTNHKVNIRYNINKDDCFSNIECLFSYWWKQKLKVQAIRLCVLHKLVDLLNLWSI